MQENELIALVEKIGREKCEGQRIEVKCAAEGCPTHLYDTLSSFSNQDDGGVIVFGLDERRNYELVGVYDVQDLQQRVSRQCLEMEPAVRALFTSVELAGKMVLCAEIPPTEVVMRPVYYKGKGKTGGSYIRIGDSDERMTDFEIYSYEAYRKHDHADRRIVVDADLSLFDENRLNDYVKAVKANRPNLSARVSDAELPEKMGLAKGGHPSVAGLMVFSAYPQSVFPQLCITAVAIPGERIGEQMDDELRFSDSKRIAGAITEMIDGAMAFVTQNSKMSNAFSKDGKRMDRREYPMLAIREAVLNALVHRDYSEYSENSPVRLELYSDRLEISNKGGLYGSAPLSSLGYMDIGRRNPLLVDTLECLGKIENRNSGIAVMRAECAAANLPPPEFSVRHGEFKVTFRNCRHEDSVVFDRRKAKETMLAYCTVPRTRDELTAFTGYTQAYTMSYLVRPLLLAGALRRTNPNAPKDPDQRFVACNS
jgi:ATP-dependent DNA helicase RecG